MCNGVHSYKMISWAFGSFGPLCVVMCNEASWDILRWFKRIICRSIHIPTDVVAYVPANSLIVILWSLPRILMVKL